MKVLVFIFLTVILVFGFVGCDFNQDLDAGTNELAKGVQVYTLSDKLFSEFPGTGSELALNSWLTTGGSGILVENIGTISGDGKLTLKLPAIPENMFAVLPATFGGDGAAKFCITIFRIPSNDTYTRLDLYNSGDINRSVKVVYFDRDITANDLGIKKGWNYIDCIDINNNWQDMQILVDISSHKWVIWKDE
jgi:hypothetical protein